MTSARGSIVVVIPALDEADNIAAVVTELLAESVVDAVVVADNGSVDATADTAATAGAVVVTEPRRGYGWACAAGTAEAMRQGAQIVVYIDGDHSSRPSEIDRLLAPLQAGQADLVLGSRMQGTIAPGAMAPHQRWGNRVSAVLMTLLYRVKVTDLGPYRAIRTPLLAELGMSEMTFGWPTEMMVKAARQRARLVEVPVSWDQRASGSSKVSGTIKGSILAGWFITTVTLRHARGRSASIAAQAPR